VGQIHSETVIVIVYVDDLLIASRNLKVLNTVKSKLCEKFKTKDLGPVTEILGICVEREGATGSIRISQDAYVKRIIEKFAMSYAKSVLTPNEAGIKLSRDQEATSKEEKEEMKRVPYRELVGQTGWSSFELLRAPRLERRQSVRPLFSFDKMWSPSVRTRSALRSNASYLFLS